MPKIAALQMCSSHNVDQNLQTAEGLIATAAKEGAKLIVLPEMFAMMGTESMNKMTIKENFGDGKIQHCMASLAKQFKVWIVAGTLPIADLQTNKITASSLIFNDHGECVARYDKIHLFDADLSENENYRESDTTVPGNKLVIVSSPFGKLGLAVCFDIRFPEMFRYLAEQGVEVFILPSAFTKPTGKAHWEILVRARAIENFCYLIAACQGGKHSNGRETHGHSMIVSPWGEVEAAGGPVGPEIIYATINRENIIRARSAIPLHRQIPLGPSKLQTVRYEHY